MQERRYLKYEIKSIEPEVEGVYTIRLRPIEKKVPVYQPGQFFMIKNDNLAKDIKPRIKPYSALHPHREDELSFGIKLHQQFSNGVCKLKVKDVVECLGPFGFFTLAQPLEPQTPLVFLAGGIGITPLLTMIESLNGQKDCPEQYLFYSNREKKDIAYFDTIKQIEKQNEKLKVIHTLTTQNEIPQWDGERGRISVDMIKKYVKDFENAHFFMCANKDFIESMQKALEDAGIVKEKIHFEKW
jgi:ferredoxin-NADP reductase